MGFFDRLKRLIRLQSITNQSINQSQTEQPIIQDAGGALLEPAQPLPIEIERDSLQLGIAAGYTGRSIRDIDSSLNRIESQMVTKDWLAIKLEEALKEHDARLELRFNRIETAIAPLVKVLHDFPRAGVESIKQVVEGITLTRKMKDLLKAVEEAKEISYADLSIKLSISQDNLRGLLSKVSRRTDKIQRFERDNTGWVRLNSDFNHQSIDKTPENTVDIANQTLESTQEEPENL